MVGRTVLAVAKPESISNGTTPAAHKLGSPANDVAVGLSDPTHSRDRKDMLELVHRLRDTGVQTDIDLPMIAVIGNQSAGKSSLIESISGITLPRSSGTCTRCPTECKLSRSDSPWTCVVKLHFHTNAKGIPIPVRLVPFGPPITNKSHVEDRIRRAQRAILNPTRDPDDYLRDGASEDNQVSFSKNYVSLEIQGKDLADLSFVDLPGLIASVVVGGNAMDIELVKSLVISYIEKPSCVILLTVACETDFENQGAYQLAKSFDPQGKRTVGVLTKPDRIPAGEEPRWLKIIRNETEPLVNNWYCVRQPSSQILSTGITWADARRQEDDYFTHTQPWCALGSQYQNYLRTSNLTERLSVILSELVAKRLPEIQEELINTIRATEVEIKKLPKAPSSDPVNEVLQTLSTFSHELAVRVQGTPNKNGLLQNIRPHQQKFKCAIRCTAPAFVPWDETKRGKALSKAGFLQNEEGEQDRDDDDDDDDDEQDEQDEEVLVDEEEEEDEEEDEDEENEKEPRPAKKRRIDEHIYIDEVMERAQSACTRELPDTYPFIVQEAFIKEITVKWREPTMALFDSIYKIMKAELDRLVERHFAEMGKGMAKQSVLLIVHDHLDQAAAQAKSRLNWLLAVEREPTTLNTHYFSDYKDKFLAYYRAARNDDLMSKLKRAKSVRRTTTTTTPSTSNSEKPSGLMKTSSNKRTFGQSGFQPGLDRETLKSVLSGLSALGLPVKAEDLSRLLPPDPTEQALHIMASVRGYFQVAYKRFADMVPMAIDHEIVLGVPRGLDAVLRAGLQITGPDGYARCKSMVEETSSVASARMELMKKMERLQAARGELRRLM